MTKAFLIDLDGTMYRGKNKIAGAKAFIHYLDQANIPYLFVTNNATRSHQEAADFLANYHDIHVSPSKFFSSVDTLVSLLNQETFPKGHRKKVYAFGGDHLKSSIADLGYTFEGSDPEKVDTVVVSLDNQVTYEELAFAGLAIQKGASFYLTNPDVQFPSEDGFVPGAGALGQLIADVAATKPIVCGKPQAKIIQGALDQLGISADQAYFLGDNLLTDIQAAKNAHVTSLLIETGVHNRADCDHLAIYPDYVFADYTTLMTSQLLANRV